MVSTTASGRGFAAVASLALFVSILMVGQIPAAAGGSFWDDDGSIHEGSIEAIAQAGITKGCGGGAFCPNSAVTRAQAASFFARAFDLTEGGSSGFRDIAGNPHAADIEKLAASGITAGCGNENFCPDQPVTRGEMASLLARALGLQPITNADSFVDDDGLVHEANIEAIAEEGVTRGCGASLYCPFHSLTRAEMATLLVRAIGLAPVDVTTTTAPVPPPPGSGVSLPAPTKIVRVSPGSNLGSLVQANPEGTRFVLESGTHVVSRVQVKNDQQFVGEPGAVVSGNGSVEYALGGSPSGVYVVGLVFERYANPAQMGVIRGGGSNWTVAGNEFRYNSGAGLAFNSGYRVINNYVHHNEQIGIKGVGSGAIVEGNEIAHNNPNDRYEYGWEAGGTKFIGTTNLVVRNNYVHDNHGPGLWTDANNRNTLYEGNTSVDNYGPGILHEISFSAVIRDNVVRGNAFPFYVGGILVTESSGVEIYGNTVSGNDGGIIGIQANRGGYVLENLWVHDNDVSFSAGWNGLADVVGSGAVWSRNNRYDRNSYTTSVNNPFRWGGQDLNWSGWRSAGQDPNGSINR